MTRQLRLDFDAPSADQSGIGSGIGGAEADGREQLASANDLAGACILVQELGRAAAAGEEHAGDRRRKVVVARTLGEGRELLRQLALKGRSWAGFAVTTLRPFALQIAMPRIWQEGFSVADRFDEQAIGERAIDDVVVGGADRFGRFVNKVGFRDAVRRSIGALREGGVHPRDIAGSTMGDKAKRAMVAAILERYEALLRQEKLVDSAGLLKRALKELDEAADRSLPGRAVYLVPGLSSRGLSGQFLRALRRGGARLLKTDAVVGLESPPHVLWDVAPPSAQGSWLHAAGDPKAADGQTRSLKIDLFAAASVYDELRGVLRRVLDRGARWDEVEIVTPDPATYGSALHALAGPLGIPVNFALGLPVERTRPGRVVSAYFRWIEGGFQEPVFRALVEAEDIVAPSSFGWIPGPRLARSLRRLRIGWGRGRYLAAVERALRSAGDLSQGRYEDDDRFECRKEQTKTDLSALKAILKPVFAKTPKTNAAAAPFSASDRTSPGDGQASSPFRQVSPAQVAAGVKSLLERVAPGTSADETATERLGRILNRIEATQHRPTDFASAANIVKGFLRVPVPAPQAKGSLPWTAIPGHLHLSDIKYGGATGRPYTFVVGMDSGRFPGGTIEDPLLLDQERRRLGTGSLLLAKERVSEFRFLFAGLFGRLRGEVTLSYCRWDPAEARSLTPSPEMLQAYRLRETNDSLTFENLERSLGLAESRLPRASVRADVDASDVWMRALATSGGRLRSGLPAVGRAYPGLASGIEADRALETDLASVHTGILGVPDGDDRPSYADPYALKYSASKLADLGTCPRRFLLKTIVRAYPPDDPEYDPERWLNALQRGSLLHKVYEQLLTQAREEGLAPDDDAFEALALSKVASAAKRMLVDVPTPSIAVHQWEVEALKEDMRSFVEMIREDPLRWRELEFSFGGEDNRVVIRTGRGPIQLRGVIDRVDSVEGGLRIVDYKTGSNRRSNGGAFKGGRLFQHFVYSVAAAEVFGEPVDRMEYHFPTRRGENAVHRYDWDELRSGDRLVGEMLEGVRKGWFPATEKIDDCRFCDFGDVCGVHSEGGGPGRKPSCRLIDWSKRNLKAKDELRGLRAARNWSGEEGGPRG